MRGTRRRGARAWVVLALAPIAVACGAIQGAPLSEAPVNAGCPSVNSCDAYDVTGAKTKPQCNDGRCEFGRPDYPFTVVVNVPDSNFYAPARSFLLASTDFGPQSGAPPARSSCVPPTCVQIPTLVRAQGKYRVTAAAAKAVGRPEIKEGTSLPIRVSFIPLLDSGDEEAVPLGVPLEAVLTSSRAVVKTREVLYVEAVPAGRYRRIAYPQPPYDAYFPPVITTLRVDENTPGEVFLDDFLLGDASTPLDDPTGDSRTATVTRAQGLAGWRIWLADANTGRRISSIRPLTGTTDTVRLDTSGQTQRTTSALKDDVEVVIAPPDSWIGVPRLQSLLLNGAGLKELEIPTLPAPASISGVVASGQGIALTGIPARVTFTSTSLRLEDQKLQPLLKFQTSVSTDNTGNFATVLPPGLYDVLVEPAEGTGFSKMRDTFDTAAALAKIYQPPARTIASGRVVLADGRPLAEAEVLALPSERPAVGTAVKPRPARTRTDRDGSFRFEVDQGQYDLVVQPQAGTGFPWFVQARSFGTGTTDIGPLVVAPPARLSFVLRDPTRNGNQIVRAMVRIFVEPAGRGPPAVEIGRALTDDAGKCEILLAQQAR